MRKKSVVERVKYKNKGPETRENNEKRASKTQTDIEKELNIRSYSKYRIKDDSMFNYVNEDIETKMIRLIIVKKKGGNVLENMNIKKKDMEFFFPIIKQVLAIIEKKYFNQK